MAEAATESEPSLLKQQQQPLLVAAQHSLDCSNETTPTTPVIVINDDDQQDQKEFDSKVLCSGFNKDHNNKLGNKNEILFKKLISEPVDEINDDSINHGDQSSICPTANNGELNNSQQRKLQTIPLADSCTTTTPNTIGTTSAECCSVYDSNSTTSSSSSSSSTSHQSANKLHFSLPLTAGNNNKHEPKDGLPKKSILSSQSSTIKPDHHQNGRQPNSATPVQEVLRRPPDGGWGWVVVFASFMINLIADGVSLTFGVIFVDLLKHFNESKSKTSWVGSLFLSIPLITGPVASALTDHFGCRKVAVVGSMLAALGFFLGQFSTRLEHLYFAFSLAGFGLAMCTVTAVVCVAYYFEKRRSLATGLSVCGTGFGTFIFAPLTRYLLEEFSWRGTLLILSGIFLNIICFGLLIRDLDIENFVTDDEDLSSSSQSSTEDDSSSDIDSNVIDSDTIDEEDNNGLDHHQENGSNHSLDGGAGGGGGGDGTDNNRKRASLRHDRSRLRHISEGEPFTEMLPRTCASLINIPTYIKNSKHNQSTQSGNVNATKESNQNDPELGELTFRRGGYLHNLIRYYPHLLSMFLPWTLECNDLTVKTVPAKDDSRDHLPTIVSSEESHIKNLNVNDKNDLLQQPQKPTSLVISGSPKLRKSSTEMNDVPHNQDSVAIPVPTPSTCHGEFIHFRPRTVGNRNLVRGGRGRHRLHQLHGNDMLVGGNCLHNLRLQRGSLTYRSAMLIISKYRLKASSAPDIYRTSMATINQDKRFTVFDNLKEILCDMVDMSTFKNVSYTIFCLSNFILYACIDIPYVYLPDQAITSGSHDQEGASLLISIIGVFNTLGVVFIGYIGDKPYLDASMIYAIFVMFSGLSLAAIPLTTNSIMVSVLTAIYGFSISANYSLVSVILVEFISLDYFTNAYGMLLLIQGIGSLIGPPVVGLLYDISGSYDNAFYLTGLCGLFSGLMVIPIGDKNSCFLWSPKKSRTGSTTSLAFRPLSFLKHGVHHNRNDDTNTKQTTSSRGNNRLTSNGTVRSSSSPSPLQSPSPASIDESSNKMVGNIQNGSHSLASLPNGDVTLVNIENVNNEHGQQKQGNIR